MITAETRAKAVLAGLLCVLTQTQMACASAAGPGSPDYDPDPWVKMNRGIFAFNEGVDRWAVEPAARVWDFVLPTAVQQCVKNVNDNAWMPAVIGNHLLQGHPKQALLQDLPRLLLNSTLGVAGLFDVASGSGIEENTTDFGITLGRWGLPAAWNTLATRRPYCCDRSSIRFNTSAKRRRGMVPSIHR